MEDYEYVGELDYEEQPVEDVVVGAAESNAPAKVKVTDIKVEVNGPKLSAKELQDPEIAALVPKTNLFTSFSCMLYNVNNAIANALRRVCMLDLKIKFLTFEHESFDTTDKYLLSSYVCRRLNLVPLKQSVGLGVKFSLFVKNTNPHAIRVYMADVKSSDGKVYFNENIELCSLKANQMLKIDAITVAEDYGFNNACAAGCIHGRCIPQDVEMLNMHTKTGVSTTLSNPTQYLLAFNTNGTIDPKELVRRACDVIIERSNYIQQLSLSATASESGEYVIQVIGENDTLGNLYMRTICDENPSIKCVNYTVNDKNKTMTLVVNSADDAREVIKAANTSIISKFTQIRKFFE